jgi:flavin reductase (DIM6/NTAB) family NADH-FMN oxidoreductase RutF
VEEHFYRPEEGHGLPHDPFKAIVTPRPIGWISTVDAEGRPNLAPYSFFNALCSQPPILGFSSEGRKDTLANIEATGEFVFNLATGPLAEAVSLTSRPVAADVDEMVLAGLAAAPSRVVRPPRVALSPAALECRLIEVHRITDLDGRPTENHLVIGQVVGVHIARAYLRDGLFDTAAAAPLARCGYVADYAVADGILVVPPAEPPIG